MLVLSTKPLQKLTGTGRQAGRQADRQTDRQTGKPMCREAAPPKIRALPYTLRIDKNPAQKNLKESKQYRCQLFQKVLYDQSITYPSN